ncbi:MAG: hypothetical protein RTV31_16270 [Candidatus Thorarchaeota archaeon]
MKFGTEKDMTIEQANQELEDSLRTRVQHIVTLPKELDSVKKEAVSTLGTIKWQTKALFAIGFFLIGLSVSLLVLSVFGIIASDSMTGLEIFGIGTLGIADLFGLFFYKPIEVSKRAMEDFAQTVILVQSWLLSIELILRGVDISDREMTMKAGALIQKVSAETVAALEKFLSSE